MAGKYTFWKLLTEREIEIPVIQRDYAQGRKSANSIRSSFLGSIEDALVNDKELDLNFVYGSIEDKNQFVPIDGQQRLTTMFLLHLYLIYATGRNVNDYKALENFKYATRMTSTYFCKEITSHGFDLEEGKLFCDITDLRAAIIDYPWFGTSWQNDPTVDAMLNMLKDIHELFGDRKDLDELLDKLLDEDKCPIYFYYLDLGEYHLEDSIYIKMNARGKALTDYENFKAKLEKFLSDNHVPDWEKLASQLDREWTEVFWNFVSDEEKKKGGDIKFDERMMNFIVAYIYNEFAYYTTCTKRDELRAQIDKLFSLSRIEFTNAFESFSKKYFTEGDKTHLIQDSFVEMFKAFSLMTDKKNVVEYSPNNGFYNEKKIFEDVLEEKGINGLTPQIRTRFYAYTQYLLRHEGAITSEGIREWFRIVEHLIAGQNFRGLDEYVHVIKGFHWLAENSTDIISFLAGYNLSQNSDDDSDETEDGLPYFNKYIFKEECIKARLMKCSMEWDAEIRKAELNPYFNGQIYVVLEFAGITESEKDPFEWSQEESKSYLQSFIKYAKTMDVLFVGPKEGEVKAGLDEKYGNNIRRALLTKGDFTMRIASNMSFLVNESNPRGDGTWKRLFRPQKDKDINIKRGYFKALLDDPAFDLDDVNGSCEKIISAYHCDNLDYKYFIEIKEVMDFVIGNTDHGKSRQCWNFFRDADQTKFLLWTTRLSGYNMDYYKYALYCVLQREGSSRLSYANKTGIDEVIREPIIITVSDNEKYYINLIRETKQYKLTNSFNDQEVVENSLESMVQYIKDNHLLSS